MAVRTAMMALAALLLGGAGEPPITAWCYGGVTGGGGGTRIEVDGSVTNLRRPRAGAPDQETPRGTDPAAYRRWSGLLDAAGFERMPRGNPGNMTCGLTRGGRQVIWANPGIPASLPPAVAQVYRELSGWKAD
ncbi:hypothetical protein ACVFYP_21695 [Roseomonas sp. F4]